MKHTSGTIQNGRGVRNKCLNTPHSTPPKDEERKRSKVLLSLYIM